MRHPEGHLSVSNIDYRLYLKKYNIPLSCDIPSMQRPFYKRPVFSLIMPVFNPVLSHLKDAILSVSCQTFKFWELWVIDDCSTRAEVVSFLRNLSHPNIRILFLKKNLGISGATNVGIRRCRGEYVGFIDHDDILYKDTLLVVAQYIQGIKEPPQVIYTDRDMILEGGGRDLPFLKPDFSKAYLLSGMYAVHFIAYRRGFLKGLGGLDPDFNGAQDFELFLRAVRRLKESDIIHIPYIGYGWREAPSSTARSYKNKIYAYDAGKRAVSYFLRENKLLKDSKVCIDKDVGYGFYTIKPSLSSFKDINNINILILSDKGGQYDLSIKDKLLDMEISCLRSLPSYARKAIVKSSIVNMLDDDWWKRCCNFLKSCDNGLTIVMWRRAFVPLMSWKYLFGWYKGQDEWSVFSPRVIMEDNGRLYNFLAGPHILTDGSLFFPFSGYLANVRYRHGWPMAMRDCLPPILPFMAFKANPFSLILMDKDIEDYPDAYGMIHLGIVTFRRNMQKHLYIPKWTIYIDGNDCIPLLSRMFTHSGREWLKVCCYEHLKDGDPFFNKYYSSRRPDLWLNIYDDFNNKIILKHRVCPTIFP